MHREVSDRGMRGFGDAGDLELNLHSEDRPALVTAILSQCDADHDDVFWWRQLAGQRIAALLRVVARTEPDRQMSFAAVCGVDPCRQEFEFEVALEEVLDVRRTATRAATGVCIVNGQEMTVRPATGADLRAWRAANPASRNEAVQLMLDALVVEGHADVSDERAVAEIAGELDPLVDFTATCTCPACGEPIEVSIDLEAHAIRRLALRQRDVLEDIHVLASHYGWTETAVLSVPPGRRQRYRELIERLG